MSVLRLLFKLTTHLGSYHLTATQMSTRILENDHFIGEDEEDTGNLNHTAIVTVGTTKFDELISYLVSYIHFFLSCLSSTKFVS